MMSAEEGATRESEVQQVKEFVLVGPGQVLLHGPSLYPTLIGPQVANCFDEAVKFFPSIAGGDVQANAEGAKINKHVRFISKDSELSDFSDSLEEFREVHEKLVL